MFPIVLICNFGFMFQFMKHILKLITLLLKYNKQYLLV